MKAMPMLNCPDYYREKAEEAEQRATETTDRNLRDGFLELARQWRAMADQAERK